MNFRFGPEDEAFRREVRDLILREIPPQFLGTSIEFEMHDDDIWAASKHFRKKLAERRWTALAWPKDYGGLEASYTTQFLFNHEMHYYGAPGDPCQHVVRVAPTLMHAGSEEQKRRLLPGIISGEEYWSTLYSEPFAGSDLASLRTTALLDGDDFVVNGEKVWATAAHRANWGWLAARTDPDAPKHQGISTFFIDMQTPGLVVEPMINLLGTHTSNRVIFDNVRVPKDNLVGEMNRGWNPAALLNVERSGIGHYAGARRDLEAYLAFAREHPAFVRARPQVRHELADRWIEMEVGYAMAYRILSMQERGESPNKEAGVAKVYAAELAQRVARAGMHLLGPYGGIEAGSHLQIGGRAARQYIRSLLATIAGGSNEVSRNNLAGRGLGLPRA